MHMEQMASGLSADELKMSTDNTSEAEIVERAKSNAEAFGQLYEANYSVILNYIYRRTLNIAVAEDLTSNTFLKALHALPKYHHRAPFRAWLYRIATNEIRMYYRKKQKRRVKENEYGLEEEVQRVHFSSDENETEEDRREKMQQYTRLHQCLAALPEHYQTVLVLRYFEGLRYSDIAKVLGKRIGTVKSLISRGLKRLRSLMTGRDATFS